MLSVLAQGQALIILKFAELDEAQAKVSQSIASFVHPGNQDFCLEITQILKPLSYS